MGGEIEQISSVRDYASMNGMVERNLHVVREWREEEEEEEEEE